MADRLQFHPLVVTDLREASQWYDEISADLGNRFRSQVDIRFDDVTQRPESFAVAFDDCHFARIHRFPYLVLFRESGDIIHVLGLFHSASDPAKWRKRATDS